MGFMNDGNQDFNSSLSTESRSGIQWVRLRICVSERKLYSPGSFATV
jgi:hypothetical protein